jgi:DNA-binding GntR family transcriptional regulator
MSPAEAAETPARAFVKDGAAVERAVAILRAKIMSGELSPGEQLRHEEMARDLGLSRAPIREALHVLAQQGLLQHRPRSGHFVAKRQKHELAQVCLMLEFLENEIMKTISWPSDDLLAELEQINHEIATLADSDDLSRVSELNTRFHFLIFRLSPQNMILDELERLWTIATPYIATKLTLPQARLRTVKEHGRILKALRARRRSQVVEELARHRYQRSELKSVNLPGWPDDQQGSPDTARPD